MNCIKYLHSFDEVKALVETVRKRRMFDPTILEHFRGQGRPEYKLLPSITRNLKAGEAVESKEKKLIDEFQNHLKIQGAELLEYIHTMSALWHT